MRKTLLLLGVALLLPACNKDNRNDHDYRADRQDRRYDRDHDRYDHDRTDRNRHDNDRYDNDRPTRRSDTMRDDNRRSDATRTHTNTRNNNNDSLRDDGSRQARTGATTATASETAFLKDAAMANLTEVEIGRMAEQKAQNDDVKQYAQRMVSDHSKNMDKLQTLARQMNVDLPTQLDPQHRQMVDRHAQMSGAEFDRAYIDMMVQDHQKVVSKFDQQTDAATNEQVRDYASSTLPKLREHLRDAQELDQQLARND